MAGLRSALPEIQARGAKLLVVGSAPHEAIGGFRAATGYEGPLLVDPSLRAFRAAGLAYGAGRTFDPRMLRLAITAWLSGLRPGTPTGQLFQQGGTFVLGPGEAVRFEWRDRFPGDHPDLREVVAALPSP